MQPSSSTPKPCCTPSPAWQTDENCIASRLTATFGDGRHDIEQVMIGGGAFWMGDAHGDGVWADGEGPVHAVFLDAFEIDVTSVTNNDFALFVAATDYITDAERHGFSAVFHCQVQAVDGDVIRPFHGTPWWLGVRGACWRHPGGRISSVEGLGEHPVVHISWHDAMAYCHWAGRMLPTEAQWESAARGGEPQLRYPWGNDLLQEGEWRCNIWQGRFPAFNSAADAWYFTAPVRSYSPNAYGLWQCVGNVWEWCLDWFDADYYMHSPLSNPSGLDNGHRRAMRGGSFLCHDSYCNRYRNAARAANTPGSTTSNLGFRTVGHSALSVNP